MSKYEYDDKDYYDDLDQVVFHAETLIKNISDKKYLGMNQRELVINAIEICIELRSNKIY